MVNRALEVAIDMFSRLCGLLLLTSVGTLVGYLLYKGMGAINLKLIFGDTAPLQALLLHRQVFDGLFPAIIGTFFLVLLALSFAVPVGIAAGIYMAEYSRGRYKYFFGFFFDVLASIPSIVVGLFGFSIAVFLHHNLSEQIYPCLLIAALSLSFLVLPYIIRTTQLALESIPIAVRLTAPALGATRLQNIFHVLIPRSLASIISGLILAVGRCVEDTAVIMLTGAVASAGIPKSIFGQFEALPFYIYHISSQYADSRELAGGYAAAVILLTTSLVLFGVTFFIKNRYGRIKYRSSATGKPNRTATTRP